VQPATTGGCHRSGPRGNTPTRAAYSWAEHPGAHHPGTRRTAIPTIPNLIRSLAAGATIVLALAAPPARAHDDGATGWDRSARGHLVDVQVLVEGRSAPLYFAPGHWDRRYFEAFRGRNYALRLRNLTGNRIGVLISVDGLNVVNGERSRQGRDEAMYVLDPWESATIRGWRTSLDEVRRFVFVDEARSYASRTGQANGDMGWIRVLAFAERGTRVTRPRPVLYDGHGHQEKGRMEDAAPAAPEANEAPLATDRVQSESVPRCSEKSLAGGRADQAYPGTGWGERREDHVSETWFVAAATPADRLVFRYEYASGLLALGIHPEGRRLEQRERGELGFAPPPRW